MPIAQGRSHVYTKASVQEKEEPIHINSEGEWPGMWRHTAQAGLYSFCRAVKARCVWGVGGGGRVREEVAVLARVSPGWSYLHFILGRPLNKGVNDRICELELSGSSAEGGGYQVNVASPQNSYVKSYRPMWWY